MVILSKIKMKKMLLGCLVFVLALSPVLVNMMMVSNVEGLSLACKNSPACMEAVAKEQEANKNALAAGANANMFQAKVNEMNIRIAQQELMILESEAQVADLTVQIAETEKKLLAEQEALAELLINMHFEGDTEPITILAGASSISDLAEKQARGEVVKQQISATAEKVKTAKEKLEADKVQIEELLARQQATKKELVATRAEQQALVSKYQNDVEAYNAIAKAAQEAQREAERQEQLAHPEKYSGSSYSGVNTYPWQADCPGRQDEYVTVGGYVCECVSYVGWKAQESYGLYLSWGNANTWDDWARGLGYVVNNTPAPDTIGQDDGGPYGHVFWVDSVNADGSINVTEYNNAQATLLYSGVFRFGDFGARKISASEARNYNYIHLK